MSELSEAISEMRNMRESYDQLAGAAEAYNEGKPALAEAITAKGVEAAATDSLATMAEKVMTISQDTYEIDGGEMYAKQLFGVANNDIVPGYWNLYKIMAQLLSDGRLVNYGGILLAEYYKGYDSLALSGAGAGGAYVVSDKDENGQFKMYTEDTTHTWATEDDGKGNRWVAYCFAEEYHDFQITNTNTSPRSIFIGRKVGTITNMVNGRCSQLVIQDGNELRSFTGNFTQTWDKRVVIKNIQSGKIYSPSIESLYLSAYNLNGFLHITSGTIPSVIAISGSGSISEFVPFRSGSNLGISYLNVKGATSVTSLVGERVSIGTAILEDTENLYSLNNERPIAASIASLYLPALEYAGGETNGCRLYPQNTAAKYIYIGYKTNDRTKTVSLFAGFGKCSNLTDIELKDGYKKNLNVSLLTDVLTAENIALHMLDRLADNTGEATLTLTIGSTNLNRILADETYAPYVAAAQAKNWTIA